MTELFIFAAVAFAYLLGCWNTKRPEQPKRIYFPDGSSCSSVKINGVELHG